MTLKARKAIFYNSKKIEEPKRGDFMGLKIWGKMSQSAENPNHVISSNMM